MLKEIVFLILWYYFFTLPHPTIPDQHLLAEGPIGFWLTAFAAWNIWSTAWLGPFLWLISPFIVAQVFYLLFLDFFTFVEIGVVGQLIAHRGNYSIALLLLGNFVMERWNAT